MASLAASPSAANAAQLQHDSSLYARVQHDEAKPGRESDKPIGSSGEYSQQASPPVSCPRHSRAAADAALLQHDPLVQGVMHHHGTEVNDVKHTGSSGHNKQVAGVIEVAARATAADSHDAAMMAVGSHNAAGAGSSFSTPLFAVNSSNKADARPVADPMQTQAKYASPPESLLLKCMVSANASTIC